MLKKTIEYKDFNEEDVVEDHYFNLTEAECVELELSHNGGLSDSMKTMIADEQGSEIVEEMKKIILTAYGKRSSDGKRFIKTQEYRDEFMSTRAYSALFMELVTQADAAVKFITGIMPTGMVDENQIALALGETSSPQPEAPPVPEPRTLTRAEAIEMDGDELQSGLAAGRYRISTEL